MKKYLKSVFSIEEVFVEVDERKNLLDDLHVGHFDKTFENIEEIHIINSIFKITVIIRADFRIAIEPEAR